MVQTTNYNTLRPWTHSIVEVFIPSEHATLYTSGSESSRLLSDMVETVNPSTKEDS